VEGEDRQLFAREPSPLAAQKPAATNFLAGIALLALRGDLFILGAPLNLERDPHATPLSKHIGAPALATHFKSRVPTRSMSISPALATLGLALIGAAC